MAQNITLLGASYSAVPAVELPKTGGGTATFTDVTDTTASASDASAGVRTQGTNSGGGGGASNFVTGTFTTLTTTLTNGTVTVPYTGSGYPVMLVIVVEGGMYNPEISGWYNSITRYAVGQVTICKAIATSTPSYETSGTNNYGTIEVIYKSSASSATGYTSTRSVTANSYASSDAGGSSSLCIRWKGNGTTISYRTAGGTASSYGLLADTTYRYYAVYSE